MMNKAFQKLSSALTVFMMPVAVYSFEAPKILRLSECRYEEGTTRLKPLKLTSSFSMGDSLDLSFQSKTEFVYPIIDWKLLDQNGEASSQGQIDVSVVEGGLNFMTWNAPARNSQDAFLVIRVNEKDCYYTQLKQIENSSIESAEPQFVKAELFPLSTSCSLQETPANFAHILISILIFTLVLVLMHRLRIHSMKLHL